MSDDVAELIAVGDELAHALTDLHAFTPLERAETLERWQRTVLRVAATNTEERRRTDGATKGTDDD